MLAGDRWEKWIGIRRAPCDLWALRRRCITNSHDPGLEITAGARRHFWTSLSNNTLCFAIYKCKFKLHHAKMKTYVNMSFSELKLKGKRSCGQMNQDSKLFDSYGPEGSPGLLSALSLTLNVCGCVITYGRGILHVWKGKVYCRKEYLLP